MPPAPVEITVRIVDLPEVQEAIETCVDEVDRLRRVMGDLAYDLNAVLIEQPRRADRLVGRIARVIEALRAESPR